MSDDLLEFIDQTAEAAWTMTRDELIAALSGVKKRLHEELHAEYQVSAPLQGVWDGNTVFPWSTRAGTIVHSANGSVHYMGHIFNQMTYTGATSRMRYVSETREVDLRDYAEVKEATYK